MKLIDILVQELPKRGGWPGDIYTVVQNSSGCIYRAGGGPNLCHLVLADDWMNAEITHEQYEAALAASKTEWNGEGLPPVGTKCEFKCGTGEWVVVEITAIARKGLCFVEPGKDGENYVSFDREFRPIRSESDKKRDEAIETIASLIEYRNGCHAKALSKWIFEEIAAGKIPGIRIE
ncbi:hypothetical protein [Lelliottia amnigena]|uniref:hypothetical protein n=1 Tax=Lelliottia amnigena TaxID=61646 RepID=UPI003018A941